MAKGYWIGRVDVNNDEGYKPYVAANAGRSSRNSAAVRGARRQVREPGRHSAHAQCGDRVSRLSSRARLLQFAGIPGRTSSVRLPHSVADIVVIEGYDGPQP